MGITGLLPFLKSIQHPTHVSSFRNQTVVVDAYVWLHKGCYSCSLELIEGRDSEVHYVNYCMRKINMLLMYKVNPIMIFDGANLPSKNSTEDKRRKFREMFRERGMKCLREGKRKEAYDNFKHCIDIKPEYALNLINACRERGIQCIVAPYEADAQLAFMVRSGMANAVISEDSDLLVFGCERVLFKMDDVGNGLLINLSEVGNLKTHNMLGFDKDSFRHMCILSGCDYLNSIPGVGLITAHKLMRKYGFDPYKVIQSLRFERGRSVPEGYEDDFKQADMTFLYQVVFDPRKECQVHLTNLPPEVQSFALTYAGIQVTPTKAKGLARGNINPITNEVMGNYTPTKDKHSQQGIRLGIVEKHQKMMTNFFETYGGTSSKQFNLKETEKPPEVSMKQYKNINYNVRSPFTCNKSKRRIFSNDSSSNDNVCVYSRFFSKPRSDSFTIKNPSKFKFIKEIQPPDISKLRRLCYQIDNGAEANSTTIMNNELHSEWVDRNQKCGVKNENIDSCSLSEKIDGENKSNDEISPGPNVLSPDLLTTNNEINIGLYSKAQNMTYDDCVINIKEAEVKKDQDSDLNRNGKLFTSNQHQNPFTTPSKDSHILVMIPETPNEDIISESKSDDSDIEISNLLQQPVNNQYFSKRSNIHNNRRPLTGCRRPKRRPLAGPCRQLALDVFVTREKK